MRSLTTKISSRASPEPSRRKKSSRRSLPTRMSSPATTRRQPLICQTKPTMRSTPCRGCSSILAISTRTKTARPCRGSRSIPTRSRAIMKRSLCALQPSLGAISAVSGVGDYFTELYAQVDTPFNYVPGADATTLDYLILLSVRAAPLLRPHHRAGVFQRLPDRRRRHPALHEKWGAPVSAGRACLPACSSAVCSRAFVSRFTGASPTASTAGKSPTLQRRCSPSSGRSRRCPLISAGCRSCFLFSRCSRSSPQSVRSCSSPRG